MSSRTPQGAGKDGRMKVAGWYMFDSYQRGTIYKPPPGWMIIKETDRPFGRSVILQWEGP
jgi:hypothetical protein